MVEVERLRSLFREATSFLERGDAVQASEKLYKVAEDCVKSLAQLHNLPEHVEAVKEGGWWTKLLNRAAGRLAKLYGEEFRRAWGLAYELHQRGFHEESMSVEDVKEAAPLIEELMELTMAELKAKKPSS